MLWYPDMPYNVFASLSRTVSYNRYNEEENY